MCIHKGRDGTCGRDKGAGNYGNHTLIMIAASNDKGV